MVVYFWLVTLISLGLTTGADVNEDDAGFSLTQTSRSNFKACTTKKGREGRCVHESYCNDDTYEIEEGGIISESELRTFECIKEAEWCCSDKNITAAPAPSARQQEATCSVSDRPDCPWCVKLYRDGNDNRKLDSGFFCMGTMIGSTVILTTATCMIQAQKQTVWARVPNSVDPNAIYTVKLRQLHPEYNSGTRAYDIALFVLEKEVQWGPSGSKGACIGVQYALEGDCMGAGIDDDENIDMTPMLVNKGTCGGGSKIDASCGHLIGKECSVVPGTPVMCRVNNGPFVMVGLAKLKCFYDPPKALLSNLNLAADWLNTHLKKTMRLQEKNYMIKI